MQTLEHQPDMLLVLLLALGEDMDVIQVDKHELVQHVMEDVVDQVLEQSWHFGEAEGHDQVFKMA